MGCVGFRHFFPLSPRLICRSSSHLFLSHARRFIVLLTTSYSLSSFSTHLCQNLFNFNNSSHDSSPKHSPFSTKITSQTPLISNTTCSAKHLHMIRTSSASMRTSSIIMISRKY